MESLSLIYYSPTRTTQKIVTEIGRNLGMEVILENNIIDSKLRSLSIKSCDCLTIIGMPVYGGRLPITAIAELRKIQSNQTPAIVVVVYGNRAYEDALLELKEIAVNCGFKIIAGAAFIGEHSYSTKDKPIANNRPDKQDFEKCSEFAQMVMDRLQLNNEDNEFAEPIIPGNYPYKERKQLPSTIHPTTNNDICHLCGICLDSCPTNAITIEDEVLTIGELCTLCCACVKNCPRAARLFDDPTVNAIRDNLSLNFSTRKEPVFFIGD